MVKSFLCVTHINPFFKNSMSEQQAPILFSLAYTSVRPSAIPNVVRFWNSRSKTKNVEWVIAVDEGDAAALVAAQSCVNEALNNECCAVRVCVNTGAKTCVAGWNAAVAATTGKVIICVADDFMPPEGWDEILLNLEPAGWIDREHVVHVDDGYVHNILVLSILTRARYERYGYVFYPRYLSLFCDTEFGEVAYRDGVVIEAVQYLFEHMHPDCHKRPRDQSDLTHASQERWNAGEMLFNFRKSMNFPVDDGPKAPKEPEPEPLPADPKAGEYVVYMQVTQDDFCLEQVCLRLYEEGIRTFFWAQPSAYWSGEPVPASLAAELDAIQARLAAAHADLKVLRKEFTVANYHLPGDSRILVETRVRNDSLAWVRREGYQHILVVDGDELWKRGTLAQVQAIVDSGAVAVSTRMIPAIGLPSYPVEQATDVAVVYIREGDFKCCRTPHTKLTLIPLNLIIHFTGTRRTMEDTIQKHRRSGHYDDPDYDFETWLREVLPQIKPGFAYTWPSGQRGVHMYLKWQIWEKIRDWYSEEIAEIPATLRRYLGGL